MTEAEWLASEDPTAMLRHLTNFPTGSPHRDNPRHPSARKLRLFACACWRTANARRRPPDGSLAAEIELSERHADGPAAGLPRSPAHSVAHPGAHGVAVEAARYSSCAADGGFAPAERAALLRCIVGNPWKPRAAMGPLCEACDGGGGWPSSAGPRGGVGGQAMTPCSRCDGEGYGPCPWLTPDVLAVAAEAYEQRGRRWVGRKHDYDEETGWAEDGTLDPERLLVLSDALEEAGCVGETCQACDGWGRKRYADMDDDEPDVVCLTCKGARRYPSPLLEHLRSPGPHHRGCWAVDLLLGKG